MDHDEARRVAERVRSDHDVPPDAELGSTTQQYIEVPNSDAAEPGPIRDVLAWLVQFRFRSSWVELAVSDTSGEVVRVRWSR